MENLLSRLKGVIAELSGVVDEIEKENPTVPVEPTPIDDYKINLDYSVVINAKDIQDENSLYHATKGFALLTERDILTRNGKYTPNHTELVENYNSEGKVFTVYTNKTEDFDATVNIEIIVKDGDAPIEEVPTDFKEVQLSVEDDGKDKTAYFREQFKDSYTAYILPKQRIWTEGILESDTPTRNWGVRKGEHGIIRIEEKNNVFIDASGTTLIHKDPAVWDGDLDGDGLTDIMPETGEKYPSNFETMSQRKFIRIIKSKYVWVDGLSAISFNSEEGHKTGKPEYDPHYEFEHFADVRDSQYVAFTNMLGKFLGGDGMYISNTDDVFIKNVTIDWNGRQGGAMISGSRCYVERYKVVNSRRGGWNIEGNTDTNDSEDFVICFSYFKTHLVGLPIGGAGFVKNVLSINNEYIGSPIWSRGDGETRRRESIMFVGHKAGNFGKYDYTNNVLIDGIVQEGGYNDNISMGSFKGCKNIHIRYTDMPSYGRLAKSLEPFYIVLAEATPIEEFKVYGNKQKIGIVNKDITVRADQVEVGNWYYKRTDGRTDFKALDSTMVNLGAILKPTRKATSLDFNYTREYANIEDAIANTASQDIGEPYKIGDKVYTYDGDNNYTERTVENLALLSLIEFPEEYVPTEQEAKSIPFPTSEYIEFHWNRLYGKSWREEEYVYDGWQPDWMNDIKK